MNAPARNPLDDFLRKLVACARLLASDKMGEREAAMAGIQRLFRNADTGTTNALADRIEGSGLSETYKQQIRDAVATREAEAYAKGVRAAEARFRPDGQLTFIEVALCMQRHLDHVPPDKHEFINKMGMYARQDLEPSPKQGKFLFDLFVQYLGGRIT